MGILCSWFLFFPVFIGHFMEWNRCWIESLESWLGVRPADVRNDKVGGVQVNSQFVFTLQRLENRPQRPPTTTATPHLKQRKRHRAHSAATVYFDKVFVLTSATVGRSSVFPEPLSQQSLCTRNQAAVAPENWKEKKKHKNECDDWKMIQTVSDSLRFFRRWPQ